jgi:F0F1-type ATP synthase assembly protein I
MAFNPPDPSQKNDDGGGLKTLVHAERLMQIAIALPAAVFIGWLGGFLLDRWLHTHWIFILGIGLGAAGGLSAAVKMALQSGEEKKP